MHRIHIINRALGLFALAAILAMLLGACGGEEEPTAPAAAGQPAATPTATPTLEPTAAPTATSRPTATPTRAQSASDRAVLVAFYHSTGGASWDANANWLSGRPIGEWRGVTTDSNGRVIELGLPGNNLTGTLPPELGRLSNLMSLVLWDNQLTGEIPLELGRLSNLTSLVLWNNQLTGEIPPELGGLSNLTGLFLHGNQLTGCIPEGLREIAKNDLAELNLPDCGAATPGATVTPTPTPEPTAAPTATSRPTATPTRAQSASDRAVLVAFYHSTGGASWDANANWLSGRPIGEWRGVTTDSNGRVIELGLWDNQLTGEIPPELGRLSNLMSLVLWDNQLTGEIPPELGRLSNLTVLGLSGNQLTGPIPPELGRLSNLIGLNLSDNQLTGEIPLELGRLSNLTGLFLHGNQLTGEIPLELGRLSNLTRLFLHGNQLTGEIPLELGRLSDLMELVLYGNQLTGPIPPELGGLSDLMELVLYGNQLTGEIPPELGGLSNLTRLDLSGNQLTGEIPPELGGLSNLTGLFLHGNQLTGEIPLELGRLSDLMELVLYGNQLTGCIPEELRDIASNDLGQLNLPDCGAATPGATVTPTPTPEPTAAPTATSRPTATPVRPGKFSEFNGAGAAAWRRMHEGGQIVACYEGLALPRDSFCLSEGFRFSPDFSELLDTKFLVAHLPDGDALVLQGNTTSRSGGDIFLGWITFENRVITHLDFNPTDIVSEPAQTATPTATTTPEPTPAPTPQFDATPMPDPGGVLTFKDDVFGIHLELQALEVVRGYAGDKRSDFWLDSGNEWVKVVIEVKNLSEDDYSFSLPSTFALVDTNNSELGDTFGAPDTGSLIADKEIAPGATVRGDIVLQAPISETFLALEVEPIFFHAQYLPLTAGSTPSPTPTATPVVTPTTAVTPTPVPESTPTQPARGECYAGLVVRPGESCTYPGSSQVLSVDGEGKGRWSAIPFLTFSGEINVSLTVNGREERFVARPQSDGSWIIEEAGGSEAQTSETTNTPMPTPEPQAPITASDPFALGVNTMFG